MADSGNQRHIRSWSEAEETMLLEIWESNSKNPELSTIKELQILIHKELSFNFNLTFRDVFNKVCGIRRQYRNALNKPHLQQQWRLFNRVHSFLKDCTFKTRDKQNGQTAQNDNSTDCSIWTIDDSNEYIGCEPDIKNLTCCPDVDIYQIEIENPLPGVLAPCSQGKEEVIELDDDDAGRTNESLITPSDNFDYSAAYEQNFTTEPLPPLAPLGTTQYTLPNFQNNFEQAATESFPSQRVFLCQPVQPQPSNIPVAVAMPNCDSTFNSTQMNRTETSAIETVQATRKKKKQLSSQSNEPVAAGSNGTIPAAEMLKKLTSIDECLQSFVQTQENLSKQIYREGLQQTMLLTRILEEEQRRTQLMEKLLKQNETSSSF